MRALRLALLVLVLAGTAVLATACAAGVPADPPGITGLVETVAQAGDGASILVTGSGPVGKASVFIDTRTVLLRKTDTGTSALLLADITAGARVSVWFDGPVAESYPVQGHAGTVLLLPAATP
jgi:hypothetical protein